MFNTIYNGSDTALKNKYFDYYAVGTTPETNTSNYVANLDKRGDATVETSTAGSDDTGWFSDYSVFVSSDYPWFIRGGYYGNSSGTGVFCFSWLTGESGAGSTFRPVFVQVF